MTERNTADERTVEMEEEVRHFLQEREKIRRIVGQLGGARTARRARAVTVVFAVCMVLLVGLDIVRELRQIDFPLPPMFSIEVGVLLVGIKIVWMVHREAQMAHFQFWILHSIEYRLNDLAQRFRNLEDRNP